MLAMVIYFRLIRTLGPLGTPPMFILVIALLTKRGEVTAQKLLGVALGLVGVVVTIGVSALSDLGGAASLAQAAVLGLHEANFLSIKIVPAMSVPRKGNGF